MENLTEEEKKDVVERVTAFNQEMTDLLAKYQVKVTLIPAEIKVDDVKYSFPAQLVKSILEE